MNDKERRLHNYCSIVLFDLEAALKHLRLNETDKAAHRLEMLTKSLKRIKDREGR